MSCPDRAIVLAAGRGFQLDGLNKVLIRHPVTGETVLDHVIKAFADQKITVVVGFRAVQIMELYPQLDYVINHEWAVTNNAMSLGMALDNKPSYVLAGDIFVEKPLIDRLNNEVENLILSDPRENRTLSAIHCSLDEKGQLLETYQGAVRSSNDPEAIGLIKISDAELLRRWKKTCIQHGNLFAAQTLPCNLAKISAVPLGGDMFTEINTSSDYLRFIEKTRAQ